MRSQYCRACPGPKVDVVEVYEFGGDEKKAIAFARLWTMILGISRPKELVEVKRLTKP